MRKRHIQLIFAIIKFKNCYHGICFPKCYRWSIYHLTRWVILGVVSCAYDMVSAWRYCESTNCKCLLKTKCSGKYCHKDNEKIVKFHYTLPHYTWKTLEFMHMTVYHWTSAIDNKYRWSQTRIMSNDKYCVQRYRALRFQHQCCCYVTCSTLTIPHGIANFWHCFWCRADA